MKISEGSKFIFIATSSKHLEDRFLYDVNYGVTILSLCSNGLKIRKT